MFFEELTDDEWARLAPLAADEPVHPHRRGRPRAEPRVVANAVLWILTTGERWSKLPARYPSGPTCRRRFDDWLADGTLVNIVNILSEFGRTFAYVPQPEAAAPAAPKAAPVPAPESPRLRGVFWTNPESWHATHACIDSNGFDGAGAEHIAHPGVNGKRPDVSASVASSDGTGPINGNGACAHTVRGDAPFASSRRAPPSGVVLRADGAVPHDAALIDSMAVSKRSEGYGDYMIHACAQPVAKQMQLSFRASAEIVRDGRRIERSGLIGPRFADNESAERYALDWARDWIDRHEAAAQAVRPNTAQAKPAVVPADSLPASERAECEPSPALAATASVPAPARALDPTVISSRAPEWLLHTHPEGRGDAKPPELVYHA
ncbi:MAG TPA: transposase [Trinickia sp.]|nr:transposase [Trinickia sp.]